MNSYKNIAEALVEWYSTNHRLLPWRDTTNPYFIWLSEIILQQTRVDQGLNYYLKFIKHYPTVHDLARADEDEVLRLWQGLGYYSRARNLHFTAKYIVDELDGEFPQSAAELLTLKGIGAYTSAAIASFSYNERIPVLDGNVYRVIARVFGFFDDITGGKSEKKFRNTAEKLIAYAEPAAFNQAIMEFGALHCTPVNPKCEVCPVQNFCYAYANDKQKELPVKLGKTKVRHRYFDYVVLEYEGTYHLKKRGIEDIWRGLYDFPLFENDAFIKMDDVINNLSEKGLSTEKLIIGAPSKEYKHILSHQIIHARFWPVKLEQTQKFKMYTAEEINKLPKPVLINKYLTQLIF